ncbi:MAG: D-alanine--D-alanine ligase [Candidatus Kinetoplastibacterium crithidii]|nr:MAG: D-alanine--D-alanine ligase [Candidatus Kinetoplastibacterium crithidii]
MTISFGKVGVLYGGQSSEREVSLISGKNIFNALKSKGLDVYLFDTGINSLDDLIKEKFAVVFIALHGRFGEDGVIQGILDLLGIPYTGSGQLSSSIAINKIITKKLWQYEELLTPGFMSLSGKKDFSNACDFLGLPLIVKPVGEGSTVGTTVVKFYEDMEKAYINASVFNNEVFAEKLIVGRELTVSIIEDSSGIKVLPIIEIITPDNRCYDYESKYFSKETKYLCPANLPIELKNNIIKISKKAYEVIHCKGWARIDLILDRFNQAWLLEINTCPGMTLNSLMPIAAKANGISYEDLCLNILSMASCKN